MKYLSLLIVLSLVLLGAGCERPTAPATPPVGTNPQIPEGSLVPADSFTVDDLSEHSTPEDCWVAIDGTVYDITGFADSHTGGSDAVLKWCGQDASHGFATKNDSSKSHSAKSKLSLDQYFKGLLAE